MIIFPGLLLLLSIGRGHYARDTSGPADPLSCKDIQREPNPTVTDRGLRPENPATLNSRFPKLVG